MAIQKKIPKQLLKAYEKREGIETVLIERKGVDFNTIANYDVILVGTPNHMGGPTRDIRKFIDKLEKLNLEGIQSAVFDTYVKKDYEKAVKKLEDRIDENVPMFSNEFLWIDLPSIQNPFIAWSRKSKVKKRRR